MHVCSCFTVAEDDFLQEGDSRVLHASFKLNIKTVNFIGIFVNENSFPRHRFGSDC